MCQYPSAVPPPVSVAKATHVQAPLLQNHVLLSLAQAPAAQCQAVQTSHPLLQALALQSDRHPPGAHRAAVLPSGRILQAAHPAASQRAVLITTPPALAHMKAPDQVVVHAAASH